MTLDAWDLADLDTFATSLGGIGKAKATWAFRGFGQARGWYGTPAWVPARDRFEAVWRQAREQVRAQMEAAAEPPDPGNEWRDEIGRAWNTDRWPA